MLMRIYLILLGILIFFFAMLGLFLYEIRAVDEPPLVVQEVTFSSLVVNEGDHLRAELLE